MKSKLILGLLRGQRALAAVFLATPSSFAFCKRLIDANFCFGYALFARTFIKTNKMKSQHPRCETKSSGANPPAFIFILNHFSSCRPAEDLLPSHLYIYIRDAFISIHSPGFHVLTLTQKTKRTRKMGGVNRQTTAGHPSTTL